MSSQLTPREGAGPLVVLLALGLSRSLPKDATAKDATDRPT
jgi:hypothetical protein